MFFATVVAFITLISVLILIFIPLILILSNNLTNKEEERNKAARSATIQLYHKNNESSIEGQQNLTRKTFQK